MSEYKRIIPLYGWIGILLVLIFWMLNWLLSGLRTQWGFFPLWLGYCLVVEALDYYRKRTKTSSRLCRAYGGQARAGHQVESAQIDSGAGNIKPHILLFLISMPCWWLFEFFNFYTKNWTYDGRQYFSDLFY